MDMGAADQGSAGMGARDRLLSRTGVPGFPRPVPASPPPLPGGDDRLGVSVIPSCRLRLQGREAREGACDILELSAEGVTIALRDGRAARRGQQGQLVIGPAEGDHYVLPVAVRWVRSTSSAWMVGLAFPAAERWTYHPGARRLPSP